MRHILGLIFCTLLPSTALAQEPLSGPEFDALTLGKTFHFRIDGDLYGGEAYRPDHVVDWSFLDGDCKRGSWYAEAGNICFSYQDDLPNQCWKFFRDGDGLRANLAEDARNAPPYSAEIAATPLYCHGPAVGV